LANCGNLKFPDFNFTDFGEKTQNFTDFGLKKQVLAMFYAIFVGKNFFHPNFRGYSPEKYFSGK
jgi:predicted rRNA methylase YqxC with S4 and FtsJ domains